MAEGLREVMAELGFRSLMRWLVNRTNLKFVMTSVTGSAANLGSNTGTAH
ncbi:hypothetical protein O9992_11970 [Vibrio lentus]|nr:hypothetical protein [Vibrio lentus]